MSERRHAKLEDAMNSVNQARWLLAPLFTLALLFPAAGLFFLGEAIIAANSDPKRDTF